MELSPVAMDGEGQQGPGMASPPLDLGNLPALIKQLDAQIGQPDHNTQAQLLQLLLNRGLALQTLGLFRKALKVGRGRLGGPVAVIRAAGG